MSTSTIVSITLLVPPDIRINMCALLSGCCPRCRQAYKRHRRQETPGMIAKISSQLALTQASFPQLEHILAIVSRMEDGPISQKIRTGIIKLRKQSVYD